MKPIIDQDTLNRVCQARASAAGDLAETRDTDWHLRVTRDRSDLRLPKGTEIVARPGAVPEPGELAVVKVVRDHVLRRAPVGDGPGDGVVVGVVVGVVREVPGDA